MHIACTNNDIEIVKILLDCMSDPEIPNFADLMPKDKSNSPMIKALIDKRIVALHGGDETAARQTAQWMSFGVGLGWV